MVFSLFLLYHILKQIGRFIQRFPKDEGTVTKKATLTEDGTVSYKCKVCGAEMGEETVTLMIESIEVNEKSVVFKCSSNIDDKTTSITVAFDDVTEELVDIIMKETGIYVIIDFVNCFTAADTDGILTDAQIKAIDYVLAHDLG